MSANLPLDVRPQWLNVIRRLQSSVSTNNGLAVVSINILVQGQDPRYWAPPHVVLIEPKSMQDDLLRLLSGQRGGI